ncbi:MAG: alpha/beta hydrolase [Alphaproteobacteria bacterium]|jgi:pimeloyl-ACP methyl ester carboxylesterase|nr:alpha/beta hydrolase [Alphaproteobacteria bacterium]MDP6515134.1 alpha/beta hydrolase [Alphaproteobacteria bacterium]
MTAATSGPTSQFYFSQRLRLHYVDWGNPDAPPLLLIHGGRDHCRNWDWIAEALRADYHVIAPDLRGHGDSQWMVGGTYGLAEFVYDIAQLIDQAELIPVRILAHSLGGMITLQYAGVYPDKVAKLIAIEGLGLAPRQIVKARDKPIADRLDGWIGALRKLSARLPRRYSSLDDAVRRMREENAHLSPEQARHLTVHGVNRNEDGTYSWKFDNYLRVFPPHGLSEDETRALWGRITCPTLLVRGTESWASDPLQDGRAAHFQNARVLNVEGAGHWVHHDRLDLMLGEIRAFLANDSEDQRQAGHG